MQDVLWSNLLLDPVGLPTYLALNKARLGEAYRRATAFLQKHDIPYRPAHAGHFVWIDLRRYLPESDEEGTPLVGEAEREVELVKRFLTHGINLVRRASLSHFLICTSSLSRHCEIDGGIFACIQGRGVAYDGKPGFFRLTFTLRPEYFDTGIRRLAAALGLAGKVNDNCRQLVTA